MASERIQKILAKAGISSRRKAEELITEGLVTVNGKVAQLGEKADLDTDAIKVKGKLLQRAETKVYLAFYKPKNVISSMVDPEGRPSLGDYFTRINERVYPIGRLDFTSEGLLLMTNDGDFAEKMQKREDVARVYQVKVAGHPEADLLEKLKKGGRIGSKMVVPYSVRMAEELSSKAKVEIAFMGAGAFDVKTLFENKGLLVDKIVRTAIGHITLKGLTPGKYRLLTPSQAMSLLEQPELGLRKIDSAQEEYEEEVKEREERAERRAEWEEKKARRRGEGRSFEPRGEKRGFGDRDSRRTSDEGKPFIKRRRSSEEPEGYGADLPRSRRDEHSGYGAERPRSFGARGKRDGFEKREGGFGKRGPRFGADRDRDEQREGGFGRGKRPGGFEKRGPRFDSERSEGGFGKRGPRFGSDRSEGREGGFEKRGSSFGGERREKREGGFEKRSSGGYGRFEERGEKRGGGFGKRGPRFGEGTSEGRGGYGRSEDRGGFKKRGFGFGGAKSDAERPRRSWSDFDAGSEGGAKPREKKKVFFGDKKPGGPGRFGARSPRGRRPREE